MFDGSCPARHCIDGVAAAPGQCAATGFEAGGCLAGTHAQAYAEYDRLVQKDREALRAARLEKILGAIQNNLEQIPELKDRLKELVKEWK